MEDHKDATPASFTEAEAELNSLKEELRLALKKEREAQVLE